MHALAERWPLLSRLPRIELTALPTQVEPMRGASETLDTAVWVKRDDLTAPAYGGNKVRKLEYLLGRARQRRANTLITAGAVGSHHVFATTLYGAEHGFETYAAVTPQPYHRHVEEQLRASLGVGAHLYPVQSLAAMAGRMAELTARSRLWGRRPYVIPPGGSNIYGALGYVNAGLELCQQVDAGLCPDFDAVYVATGTCATVAGLALGLAAGGMKTTVVGVRVFDRLFANRVRIAQLIQGAEEHLTEVEPRFPRVAAAAFDSVVLDVSELGRGYGVPTPSSAAALELGASDGLTLDETYTSKALASLVRDATGERRGQNLLYWHTLSSASLEPFAGRVLEPPERFVKLMTLT